jgi:CheY-like chemotaxis protein
MNGELVLVVEDDHTIRQALCEAIERDGFATAEARDGASALRWLQTNSDKTAFVLLDLMTPGIDGVQFLDIRDKDKRLKAIPVAVMSAFRECREIATRFQVDCLPKPLRLDDLLTTLHYHVS